MSVTHHLHGLVLKEGRDSDTHCADDKHDDRGVAELIEDQYSEETAECATPQQGGGALLGADYFST